MFNKTSISSSALVKSELETSFSQILPVIILLIVSMATFTLQNRIVGLEPGYDDFQPKHHGWVTANTLAIISKATPEHYFVGYALAFKDDQNQVQYEYFDRYPVFFSALLNRVLSLSDNLADQLYLAKQMSGTIFLNPGFVFALSWRLNPGRYFLNKKITSFAGVRLTPGYFLFLVTM